MHAFRLVGPVREPSQGDEMSFAKTSCVPGPPDAILDCDCLVAILDGRTIDEGVAFELGVAFSAKKRCFAIQTDSRCLAIWGNNPMITGALEFLFHSVDDLVAWFNSQQNGAKNNFARK